MSGRLDGKVAVITGAGQGIGRAGALAFAREGATVWALDRNPDPLGSLTAESDRIVTRVLDVTDRAGLEQLAAEVDGPGVLFNCAGIVPHGTILDCSEEEWAAAFEINVTSMYRTIQVFLPAMLAAGGGSIVNVASVASSVQGVPARFAYGATKAAVIGLTKAVAADFIGRGVRCNAICPGTIDTPSLGERLAAFADPAEARREFVARQPLGRLGTAEEVAALALHLASDESGFTTGAIHIIDGGMTL